MTKLKTDKQIQKEKEDRLIAKIKYNLKYELYTNWDYICRYCILSENFIKKFAKHLDWYRISRHQKLSESLITKFSDKVDWYYISLKQKLSEKFIQNNKKIYWNVIPLCFFKINHVLKYRTFF